MLILKKKKWKQYLGFMVTSWVVLAIIFILAILLLNLILLHVYLGCKGYTTYQFIMVRREEERREEVRKKSEENMKKEEEIRVKYQNMKKEQEIRSRKISNSSKIKVMVVMAL